MAEPANTAFTVNPQALHELAKTLSRLSVQLSIARIETQQIDASQFGDRRLADAANHFVDHWQWQADRLGTALDDTAGHLNQAATQYQTVEDAQNRAQGGSPGPTY